MIFLAQNLVKAMVNSDLSNIFVKDL